MFRSSTVLYYTQNVRLVTNHTPAWWHVKGWVSVTVDTFVSSIFHLDYDPYYNSIRASDSSNFSIPFLLWRVTFPLLFKKWICEVFLVKFGAVLIIMTVALVCYTRVYLELPFFTSGVLRVYFNSLQFSTLCMRRCVTWPLWRSAFASDNLISNRTICLVQYKCMNTW